MCINTPPKSSSAPGFWVCGKGRVFRETEVSLEFSPQFSRSSREILSIEQFQFVVLGGVLNPHLLSHISLHMLSKTTNQRTKVEECGSYIPTQHPAHSPHFLILPYSRLKPSTSKRLLSFPSSK